MKPVDALAFMLVSAALIMTITMLVITDGKLGIANNTIKTLREDLSMTDAALDSCAGIDYENYLAHPKGD